MKVGLSELFADKSLDCLWLCSHAGVDDVFGLQCFERIRLGLNSGGRIDNLWEFCGMRRREDDAVLVGIDVFESASGVRVDHVAMLLIDIADDRLDLGIVGS